MCSSMHAWFDAGCSVLSLTICLRAAVPEATDYSQLLLRAAIDRASRMNQMFSTKAE